MEEERENNLTVHTISDKREEARGDEKTTTTKCPLPRFLAKNDRGRLTSNDCKTSTIRSR
jgi:hypothetical protein